MISSRAFKFVVLAAFIAVWYFGLAFAVFLGAVLRRGFDSHDRSAVSRMIDGTASRPFVYRVLVPKLAFTVDIMTPDGLKQRVVQTVRQMGKRIPPMLLGDNADYAFAYLVIVCMGVALIAGSALLWYKLLSDIYKYPEYICWLLPPFGLISLFPIIMYHGPYVYDPMTLFSFSLGVYALCTHRRLIYYVAFLLALFNKETALLLPFLFLASFFHSETRLRLMIETCCQVTAWILWRAYLTHTFSHNPGVNMEYHLTGYNLRFFLEPNPLHHLRFWTLLFAGALLTAYKWRQKPLCLRRVLLVSLVFLLPLHITFAWIDEFRALLEVYPTLLALSISALLDLLGYEGAFASTEKHSRS